MFGGIGSDAMKGGEMSGTMSLHKNERLKTALQIIKDPKRRQKIRRIYERQFKGASVFWDSDEKWIEFISDEFEITIRERER
jgi:hypothetical protein